MAWNRILPEPIEQRFAAKYRVDESGCWIWTGSRLKTGYGCLLRIMPVKKFVRAHRLSWELAHGEMPPRNVDVCHTCDVRLCVNPAHLFLGTRKENMQDMVRKGRSLCGEKQPRSKLTNEDAELIRFAVETLPVRHIDVAQAFGVSRVTVSNIVNRKSYCATTF